MESTVKYISIIVPVYQDWADALQLLECLQHQSLNPEDWEVIIVDNGSDWIPDLGEYPFLLRVLECSTPGSYAARNVGVRAADGELLVFTDADCRPQVNWLESLSRESRQEGCPELIAGSVRVKPLHEQKPNQYELYDMALGLPQKRYVSRGYAITANLAIRRSVFDKIGSFDDARFSGGDAEFCRRAVAAGYRLTFCEPAEVVHPARDNWSVLSRKIRRVKGGQVRNGTPLARVKFLVRTFLPPVFAYTFALNSDRLTWPQRLSVCAVQTRLWFVEMLEVVRLLSGKLPERR